MSGIDIAEEVTASQLEALAGGELLKAEVHVCLILVTCSLSHSLSLSLSHTHTHTTSLNLLTALFGTCMYVSLSCLVCILLSSP